MKVRCAIIGYGTVGAGAARILIENRAEILRKTGLDIELAAVCGRSIESRDTSFLPEDVYRLRDWRKALSVPDVPIVVELIGGTAVAAEVVQAALMAGKSI